METPASRRAVICSSQSEEVCLKHADGKKCNEISRKIGAAHAEFKALNQVWKSSNVSSIRKLKLFDSYILSKLRYGVASAWLSKADLRRLDGFQARCLRILLGVKPASFSRISNERVRSMAGQKQFSETVADAQLDLLHSILDDHGKQELRDVAFQKGTETPLTAAYVRKVGRPRHS